MELAGFTRETFTAGTAGPAGPAGTVGGVTRAVYRRGHGPGIVVMHEMPGITPEVARFGVRLADAGFTVFLPHLFGTPGRPIGAAYNVGQLARACVSREFAVLAANGRSPIIDWLRALCRRAHDELGGPGVGALGMCITGNFALSLVIDAPVIAPVLSQPSLPLPLGAARKAGLHMTPADLACLRARTRDDGLCVLGLRFTGDPLVPAERFEHLRAELGDAFEGIEIDSRLGNPHGIPRHAHSVLTNHFVDTEGHPTRVALERVIAFFRERLAPDT